MIAVDTFVLQFPLFKNIACKERSLIEAKLELAETYVDRDIFGDRADYAVMLKAAALLEQSGCGRRAGSEGSDSVATSFSEEFERMKMTFGFACRVI